MIYFEIEYQYMSELVEPTDTKKGGPYSSNQRRIRRERVADLFFVKSYSTLDISRMLNVNRNTVTNDLKYCYSEIKKESDNFSVITICITQFHRMEIQRKRLVDYLVRAHELSDRLAVERMVTDLENKIMQAALKIGTSSEAVQKLAIGVFNIWAKDQNPAFRGIPTRLLRRLSPGAKEKIDKIIEEDEKNSHNSCLGGIY